MSNVFKLINNNVKTVTKKDAGISFLHKAYLLYKEDKEYIPSMSAEKLVTAGNFFLSDKETEYFLNEENGEVVSFTALRTAEDLPNIKSKTVGILLERECGENMLYMVIQDKHCHNLMRLKVYQEKRRLLGSYSPKSLTIVQALC